eukprot:8285630-Pyramimonas_sp.AAC.1
MSGCGVPPSGAASRVSDLAASLKNPVFQGARASPLTWPFPYVIRATLSRPFSVRVKVCCIFAIPAAGTAAAVNSGSFASR